jgi:hypothetical protein
MLRTHRFDVPDFIVENGQAVRFARAYQKHLVAKDTERPKNRAHGQGADRNRLHRFARRERCLQFPRFPDQRSHTSVAVRTAYSPQWHTHEAV